MSLNHISTELQKAGYGYQLDEQTETGNLFSMDDLNLPGTNHNQLSGLVNTVKIISDDIKMESGLNKCNQATLK